MEIIVMVKTTFPFGKRRLLLTRRIVITDEQTGRTCYQNFCYFRIVGGLLCKQVCVSSVGWVNDCLIDFFFTARWGFVDLTIHFALQDLLEGFNEC